MTVRRIERFLTRPRIREDSCHPFARHKSPEPHFWANKAIVSDPHPERIKRDFELE